MKAKISILLALCVAIVLGCSNNRIKLVSHTPSGETPNETNFSFTFNNSLAPAGKIGQWIDDPLVEFTPAIPGKFKWTNSNVLVFSPLGSLIPGQEYKAKFNTNLLQASDLKADLDDIRFHTEYFKVKHASFFWSPIPKETYKVEAQAKISFNYLVDMSELRKYLSVEKDGVELPFEILTSEASTEAVIKVGTFAQKEQTQNMKLTIKKGMPSIQAKDPLSKDFEHKALLPAITDLAFTYAAGDRNETESWIELGTTQQIDADIFKEYTLINGNKISSSSRIVSTPSYVRVYIPSDEDYSSASGDDEGSSALLSVVVKKGLTGLNGGVLNTEYEAEVSFMSIVSSLQFSDKAGKYLMKKGEKNVGLQMVNLDSAIVEVAEILPRNVIHFIKNASQDYDYYEDYDYSSSSVNSRGNHSYDGAIEDQAASTKTKTIKFATKSNQQREALINIDDMMGHKSKGVYYIQARSTDEYWNRKSKIVSISDMAMITKQERNGMHVWVHDINSTEAVGGAELKLYARNSKIVGEGKTNGDGYAYVPINRNELTTTSLLAVTAEYKDDFNYLDINEALVSTSRFEVSGRAESESGFTGYIYGARDLYRPGEMMHFNCIVRGTDYNTPSLMPFTATLTDFQGTRIQEWNVTTNEQGSFEIHHTMPFYAKTGRYSLQVFTGAGLQIAEEGVRVEEFAPDKIRVSVKADKSKKYGVGDDVKVDIESKYLFGNPAANHNYDLDIFYVSRSYKNKAWDGYNFDYLQVGSSRSSRSDYDGTDRATTSIPNGFSQGILSTEGKAVYNLKLPENVASGKIYTANVLATVFDITGKSVSNGDKIEFRKDSYFLGMKKLSNYASLGMPMKIEIAAVDPSTHAGTKGNAKVVILKYKWTNTLVRNSYNNSYYYKTARESAIIKEMEVDINNTATVDFVPEYGGDYEVQVYTEDGLNYLNSSFYVVGRMMSNNAFGIEKEGTIKITPNKTTYAPGEKAKLLFVAPFSGKMLVTLERNKVQERRIVTLNNNSGELEFDIKDDMLPNIFVSATLIRKHKADSETPFFVAVGYQNLLIEKPSNKLEVKIEAPEKIKPRTKQTIKVNTNGGANTMVTIAMVDEGILQQTRFETPDPYTHFYTSRQLDVSSHSIYRFLLPEILSKNKTGGGDDYAAKMESSYMADATMANAKYSAIRADRIVLFSYWSGALKADKNGDVQVEVDIPDFNGEARIMAVAYEDKKMGSTSQAMTILDDVVVLAGIPRFLGQNDKLMVPVSLLNTKETAGEVELSMTVEGPMQIQGASSFKTTLSAKGENTSQFTIATNDQVGVGKITITTKGLDNLMHSYNIAVRPNSPLLSNDLGGSLANNSTTTIQSKERYLAGTSESELLISKFPITVEAKMLHKLIGYPYGCMEQTISKAFPQLYVGNLMEALTRTGGGNTGFYIKEAINKIQALSGNNGRVSYWPGGGAHEWTNIYAAHFLLESEKAGYAIDKGLIEIMLQNIKRGLNTPSNQYAYSTYNSYGDGYYEEEGLTKQKKRWSKSGVKAISEIDKEKIYSLFVLALGKQPDISRMNYYKARYEMLPVDMRYMLAACYAMSENWPVYHELVPKTFETDFNRPTQDRNFDSEVRSLAIALNTIIELEPESPQVLQLAGKLSKALPLARNTQDWAWSIMALGKMAKKVSPSDADVTVKLEDGTVVYSGKIGRPVTIRDRRLINAKLTISTTGDATVYYNLHSQGIIEKGKIEEKDNNLKVRRTYVDRFGAPIKDNTVKQGQLVICRLTVETGGWNAENVVISDLIPSGFEIVNPRLTVTPLLPWLPSKVSEDIAYMDFRDDRLLIFTGPYTRRQSVTTYYMMRATNIGEFSVAPVQAESMYNPEKSSINGAIKVTVLKGDGSMM